MEEELTGKQIDLPPEVMHEILLRLPVKPLYRFKLVSKPWLSLISNPKFIAMHSKAIENNKDVFSQRRRLVFTDANHHYLYSLDLDQFLDQNHAVLKNRKHNEDVDGPVAVATELDFVYNQFPSKQLWAPFIHSCNSLLLSESFYGYHLINPVAKESKKLPTSPIWRCNPLRDLYGFGFDCFSKQYKVIFGEFFDGRGIRFSVYTLETDSWRRIKLRVPCRPTQTRDGVVVNGCVHWLLRNLVVDKSMLMILSVTLAEEKFIKIPLPSLIGISTGSIELGVFRDWLCITFSSAWTEVPTYNEFWVMKEYGVRKSWTRMRVSIPYRTLSHSGFWRGSYHLMVFDRSTLIMYNFEDEEFWTLSIKNIGKGDSFGSVGIYVESLASLVTQDPAAGRESSA